MNICVVIVDSLLAAVQHDFLSGGNLQTPLQLKLTAAGSERGGSRLISWTCTGVNAEVADQKGNSIFGTRTYNYHDSVGPMLAWGHHYQCQCAFCLSANQRANKNGPTRISTLAAGWDIVGVMQCGIAGCYSWSITKNCQSWPSPTIFNHIQHWTNQVMFTG